MDEKIFINSGKVVKNVHGAKVVVLYCPIINQR